MVRILVLPEDKPLVVDEKDVLLDERIDATDFPDERSAKDFIEKLAFVVATDQGDIE